MLHTRKLIMLGLMIALTLTLFACGTATDPGPSDEGERTGDAPVELTVWVWPGMGIEEQMQQYAEEHNLRLNIQTTEMGDLHTNLTTALVAGSGAPDITAVDIGYIERFKQNPEHFYNLLDLGAGQLEDDYLDWKWRQALTGDESALLGLPTDIGPQALAYRIDLFEQAGLPTDREEVAERLSTWDEFLEVGRQIKEATGKPMVANAQNMYNVILGQGELKYFDTEDRLVIEENPQIEKAWEYTMQAISDNLTGNIPAWTAEWGAGMANGDYAVELAPAWMMGFIKSNAPEAEGLWDITFLPEGSGNWGGSFFSIPKESQHAEEALGLIQWLLSAEQQLVTFQENGNFPSTPAIYDDPAIQDFTDEYFNNAPVGQIYAEAAQLVEPVYEGPYQSVVNGVVGDAINSVENGQATPEQAWETAISEIGRQLER